MPQLHATGCSSGSSHIKVYLVVDLRSSFNHDSVNLNINATYTDKFNGVITAYRTCCDMGTYPEFVGSGDGFDIRRMLAVAL